MGFYFMIYNEFLEEIRYVLIVC